MTLQDYGKIVPLDTIRFCTLGRKHLFDGSLIICYDPAFGGPTWSQWLVPGTADPCLDELPTYTVQSGWAMPRMG